MDRYTPRNGSGLIAWQHIQFQQDATQKALANAFGDYIAIADSFYVSGGEVTATPNGTGMDYAITDGVVCIRGEFMPVAQGAVLKSASQVVCLVVDETGVDDYPDSNIDGGVDFVMRERKAVLLAGVAYPVGSVSLNLARKSDLDMARLKGRVVPKGGILPYFGAMTGFDATGMGIAGTSVEGFAVCNGLNGTIDMRGLTPMGATNVPASGAGTLFGGVGAPSDAGEATGSDRVQINASNLPPHTHPYHDEGVDFSTGGPVSGGGGGNRPNTLKTSEPNVTNNDPMSVRQASRSLAFIQSII